MLFLESLNKETKGGGRGATGNTFKVLIKNLRQKKRPKQLYVVVRIKRWLYETHSVKHFAAKETQNTLRPLFGLHKISRLADFEALTLRNLRSGIDGCQQASVMLLDVTGGAKGPQSH